MATSCKDAIKLFEQAEGKVAADCEDVRLCPISLQQPVIQKMDASLSSLKKCKHLRLSTNSIDKITGLNGMEQLQILSLGRNQIRKIEGLEQVQETLEQLWVSYNQIGSLAGIEKLQNLQVLYMSNNKIDKWAEVERLKELPKLRDLLMVGNPLMKKVRPCHRGRGRRTSPRGMLRGACSGEQGRGQARECLGAGLCWPCLDDLHIRPPLVVPCVLDGGGGALPASLSQPQSPSPSCFAAR